MECILKEKKITPTKETNEFLKSINTAQIKDGISLYDLLKRPEINFEHLCHFVEINYSEEIKEQLVINTKYAGYIVKANREAEKIADLDNKKIPENIDYDKVNNLASEARQKLKQIRPTSIGQALRISGVNPSDVSILSVYMKRYFNDNR